MSAPHDMAERQGRVLAELSELGLTLARDLHRRAMAADDDQEAARLASAFHRISRSVRQSLALEAKLERDHARGLREAEAGLAADKEAAIARRKAEVRASAARQVWTAWEGFEAEDAVETIDSLLDEDALADPDLFLARSPELHIARMLYDIGLEECPDELLVEDPDDPETGFKPPPPRGGFHIPRGRVLADAPPHRRWKAPYGFEPEDLDPEEAGELAQPLVWTPPAHVRARLGREEEDADDDDEDADTG